MVGPSRKELRWVRASSKDLTSLGVNMVGMEKLRELPELNSFIVLNEESEGKHERIDVFFIGARADHCGRPPNCCG